MAADSIRQRIAGNATGSPVIAIATLVVALTGLLGAAVAAVVTL